MPKQLEVWLFDAHVGTLAQIDGRLGFTYAPDWLTNNSATPLSQSLPLQAAPRRWCKTSSPSPSSRGVRPSWQRWT